MNFEDKWRPCCKKDTEKMVTMVRKKEHGQIGDHGAFVDKIAVMLQKGNGKNGNYGTKKRTWTSWRPWCICGQDSGHAAKKTLKNSNNGAKKRTWTKW